MKATIQQVDNYTTVLIDDVPQSTYLPPKNGYWHYMIPDTPVKTCLMLGVGGGTTARLLIDKFPDIKITGVDNSQDIINLAREYMKLDEVNMEVVIGDAFEYIEKVEQKFDLILVDLFAGYWFPLKILTPKFLHKCQELLEKDGFLYINTPNIEYGLTLQLPTRVTRDMGANTIYGFQKSV